jgi:rod shape-determining protein MreC
MPSFLKEKRNFALLAGLVFFHLVLISIQVPLGSEQTLFGKIVFSVLAPVQRAFQSAVRGVSGTWSRYVDLRSARRENQKLRRDAFFLRQENMLLRNVIRSLRGEEIVKESLARFEKSLVAARVIGFDASNYYRSAVLNKGSLDGIKKDMSVCDKNGNLVGRTIEPVLPREARVQLITDDESGVSVVSEKAEWVGILTGNAQGLCLIKYILTTAQGGSEGDELVTTGFDKIHPPGIKVGKIISIGPGSPLFKRVLVEPYFRFNDLDQVAVLKTNFQEVF